MSRPRTRHQSHADAQTHAVWGHPLLITSVNHRSAVACSRLEIAPGWELAFTIAVHDDQIRAEVLREILTEAGDAVGIGDFRPRHERFGLLAFEVSS